MKRNLIYPIVVVLFAAAYLLYLRRYEERNKEQMEHRPHQIAISCVKNLKQIGLAFRIWEGDHGDQFPFNISTNAGGTMELCAVGKDGFDNNSFLHFKAMTGDDYLRVPLLLVCPQDRSKKVATNWPSLGAENVTYRLHSGTNISDANPQAILAVCPIDGNILYCDGHVTDKKGNVPAGDENVMQIRVK